VCAGLRRGLLNKEIASGLGISRGTVSFHLGNIYRKLGARSRVLAALLAPSGKGLRAELKGLSGKGRRR
jgi:DNA-binding NarL/FixJ family response regulator